MVAVVVINTRKLVEEKRQEVAEMNDIVHDGDGGDGDGGGGDGGGESDGGVVTKVMEVMVLKEVVGICRRKGMETVVSEVL